MPRDVISSLPEDLVQIIAVNSDIADVFALKQTCRNLNRLTDSDYLWHQLLPREELPLDLPSHLDFRKLSALELRASAQRALKLRYNWSRKHPKVRGIYIANFRAYDGTFDELKLLNGGSVLLGIRRDRHSQRPAMMVSAYSLVNVENPHLAAHLSISATMKDFDACLEAHGDKLILAATLTKGIAEVLEVYSIDLPLESPTSCNGSYNLAYSFELQNEGLFHKVSLHGNYIAASIMSQTVAGGGESPQVLIANWKTRQQITITPRSNNNLDQLDVKVLPPYLGIVAASVDNAQVTLVPLSVIKHGGILEQPAVSRTRHHKLPHFPNATTPLMDFYDICISSNAGFGTFVPPTSISLIIFPTLSRIDTRPGKKALHLRFAIKLIKHEVHTCPQVPETVGPITENANDEDYSVTSIEPEKSTPFDIPLGSYPEHAHLGTTGRRAVWLEQSLKSDYVQILRLDYDPIAGGEPAVSVLLPPDPQLPFKPSSCRALAFDEATGRLCVGLYNGAVYILDYA